MGATRVGKTTDPTIAKFWSERAWHEQLGVSIDQRPVAERPWREVREYELLMQAEVQVHKSQQAKR